MAQFIEGFFLQASLIFALGAQNIFVLESGLKKNRPLLVATICSLCDTLLIAVGVLGAATIFVQVPALKIGFGILGVFFLALYGGKKLLEAWRGGSVEKPNFTPDSKKVAALALGFSLLNPHVYLDTVILIGGYSAKFPALGQRALFGAGAAGFSCLWFFSLAIFGAAFSALLNNRRRMRIVSAIAGVILIALAVKLGWDVAAWARGIHLSQYQPIPF